jgi:predicted Zn-dependent peptidase
MPTRFLAFALLAAGNLPAQVKLPAHTKQVLPSGATLILLRKPDVPMVTVRALFRGGAEAEPAGKAGLASLTAELVRRGAAQLSNDQINEQLDSLGANLMTGVNRQASFVSLETTSRTAAKALEVFSAILTSPSFPDAEFKKLLTQRLDASKAAKDNPGMAIGQYFGPFLFPASHPYSRPLNGDEVTLAGITRDDVIAFHKASWNSRNLILLAAGDIDEKAMAAQLGALAGALPRGEAFRPADAPALRFDAPRLLLVDKPDATQTYFRIAMPGIARSSPDRVALMVVNTLFGGRFTSMLNDELRVNSGLTYGAGSQIEMNRLAGVIAINTYTRTDATVKAIDLCVDLLHRLREKGLTADQLQSAKNYIKGNYPLDELETADQIAALLGDIELFGLNRGEVDDLFSTIDSITLEKANAIARHYYVESNLQFLLVGNASKIQDGVKKYAPRMKVLSVKEPGFTVPAF